MQHGRPGQPTADGEPSLMVAIAPTHLAWVSTSQNRGLERGNDYALIPCAVFM
jgi:hypothetical protein